MLKYLTKLMIKKHFPIKEVMGASFKLIAKMYDLSTNKMIYKIWGPNVH